jgi:hypothetical protein
MDSQVACPHAGEGDKEEPYQATFPILNPPALPPPPRGQAEKRKEMVSKLR